MSSVGRHTWNSPIPSPVSGARQFAAPPRSNFSASHSPPHVRERAADLTRWKSRRSASRPTTRRCPSEVRDRPCRQHHASKRIGGDTLTQQQYPQPEPSAVPALRPYCVHRACPVTPHRGPRSELETNRERPGRRRGSVRRGLTVSSPHRGGSCQGVRVEREGPNGAMVGVDKGLVSLLFQLPTRRTCSQSGSVDNDTLRQGGVSVGMGSQGVSLSESSPTDTTERRG